MIYGRSECDHIQSLTRTSTVAKKLPISEICAMNGHQVCADRAATRRFQKAQRRNDAAATSSTWFGTPGATSSVSVTVTVSQRS